MPDKKGRFLLYSDTSNNANGSALYQVQDGRPRFIAYACKRMPEAAFCCHQRIITLQNWKCVV